MKYKPMLNLFILAIGLVFSIFCVQAVYGQSAAPVELEVDPRFKNIFETSSPMLNIWGNVQNGKTPLVDLLNVNHATRRNVAEMPQRDFYADVSVKTYPKTNLIHPDQIQYGSRGLNFEWTVQGGVHFWYRQFYQEKIRHTWFVPNLNLRNKNLRISYIGNVPYEITFLAARSASGAKHSQKFNPQNAIESKFLTLHVPDTKPFESVTKLMFEIVRSQTGKKYADFTIEKIEVINDEALKTEQRDE